MFIQRHIVRCTANILLLLLYDQYHFISDNKKSTCTMICTYTSTNFTLTYVCAIYIYVAHTMSIFIVWTDQEVNVCFIFHKVLFVCEDILLIGKQCFMELQSLVQLCMGYHNYIDVGVHILLPRL